MDRRFSGSTDDLRDGFIHLSVWAQLAGTIERHFSKAGDQELIVAGFRAPALGTGLRWEPARNGQDFPHLYEELRAGDVTSVLRLVRSAAGTFVLPAEEPA